MQQRAPIGRSGGDQERASVGPFGLGRPPAWLAWTVVAFAATVFHLLIDMHLGLFGEISSDMSTVKGLWGLTESILLGWWLLITARAAAGHGPALKASLVLTGLLALVFNGLVAVAAAPPSATPPHGRTSPTSPPSPPGSWRYDQASVNCATEGHRPAGGSSRSPSS